MCKNKQTRFEVYETTLTSPSGSTLPRQMIDSGHAIFLLVTDNRGKWLFLKQRVPLGSGIQYNIPTTSFDPKSETLKAAVDRLTNEKCGVGICMLEEICSPFQLAPTYLNSMCHVVVAQLAIRSLNEPLDTKAIEKVEWVKSEEVKKDLSQHILTGIFKAGLPLDGRAQISLLIAEKLKII